jgi:AAA+ superfamily predicted ATPase
VGITGEIEKTDFYLSNAQFLNDKLNAVTELITRFIEINRPPEASGGSPFFVETNRVLSVLRDSVSLEDGRLATYSDVEARFSDIKEKVRRSVLAGTHVPLAELEARFGLEEVDGRLILLAAAPLLSPWFEEVFGYLNNDLTRRSVTPVLAASLLDCCQGTVLSVLGRLSPTAPLFRYHLMEQVNGVLSVPAPVFEYIIGDDGRKNELSNTLDPPGEPDDKKLAKSAADLYVQGIDRFYFVVAEDLPRVRAFIAEVCRLCGLNLPCAHAQTDDPGIAVRDAILGESALSLKDPAVEILESYRSIVGALPPRTAPLIFVLYTEPETYRSAGVSRYIFPYPDAERRSVYWRFYGGLARIELGDDVDGLSYDYRLSGDDIKTVVFEESGLAVGERGLSVSDLRERCREYSSRIVKRHLRPVRTNFQFEDIVLPTKSANQLREIVACVRNRRIVLDEWGFAEKLPLGVGVSVLFSGPSGTGKTMAAGIIANELELPLFKVDLSSVVSKYIGETEKNLKAVFESAESANAVVFFDEADALFGKRTEVKDAHDRYANIEVSFLLQQMEEYSGLAILATNKKEDIDKAFLRRIHIAVEFPFPNAELRESIWRKIFPSGVPLPSELDFGPLARKYSLSGGNIKNAALLAAYLAADRGTKVGEAEILSGIKREYGKLGKTYPGD